MGYLLVFALLFLSACDIEDIILLPPAPTPPTPSEEHIEIIIIGPYRQRCHGAHGERDCLMIYNEDSNRWGFFFDGVEGFDFEPGFIYTLEVRLEDLGPYIQDAGPYAYHLLKIIEKKKAPEDFSYDTYVPA